MSEQHPDPPQPERPAAPQPPEYPSPAQQQPQQPGYPPPAQPRPPEYTPPAPYSTAPHYLPYEHGAPYEHGPQYPYGSAPAAPPAGGGPHVAAQPGTGRRTILIAAVVAALIGGGIGAGTVAIAGNNGSPSSSAGLAYSTQQAPAAKVDGTVTAAAAKISPSVVTINVTAPQQQDTGSGVIIRTDGYILTNNHVISAASGGGSISVTLADGRVAKATVVGADPSDDLAVVKIGLSGLTAATFASSSALQVGQTVVAVGAPLGLSDTVTAGIVSNTARPVTTSDSNNDQAVFNAVQTDAAINPGNSGGPLVNLNGDVVGINAAIATDQSNGGLQLPGQVSQAGNIGIGFAIPSDEAGRIAGQLITTGKATHAVMGVEVGGTQSGGSSGALIKSVTAGSGAANAGLKAGDLVTELDGQRIDDATALVAAVRSHAPGQQVKVTYARGGSSHTTTLTLGTGSN
jgi:putative serine protease PepD